jgi:hypothetical protein
MARTRALRIASDAHGASDPHRIGANWIAGSDQATWAKVSITVERSDGGIVDAEIIRPRSWILASGLCAGRMLPPNLPELEVSGLALVTSISKSTASTSTNLNRVFELF